MEKYKILFVDDDNDIVSVVSERLSREGYPVVTAFDGAEALEKVASEDPDIILLDLVMPRLNGFDVLKEVRKKYNDRWRPVIIISAQSDLEDLKICYNLEADHYLTKPCTIENILRAIQTMVSLIPLRIHKNNNNNNS